MNIFKILSQNKLLIYGKNLEEVKREIEAGMYTKLDQGILLDSGAFLDCTIEHYRSKEKTQDVSNAQRRSPQKCYYTRRSLDINCDNNDCANCHLAAIQRYTEKQIIRR